MRTTAVHKKHINFTVREYSVCGERNGQKRSEEKPTPNRHADCVRGRNSTRKYALTFPEKYAHLYSVLWRLQTDAVKRKLIFLRDPGVAAARGVDNFVLNEIEFFFFFYLHALASSTCFTRPRTYDSIIVPLGLVHYRRGPNTSWQELLIKQAYTSWDPCDEHGLVTFPVLTTIRRIYFYYVDVGWRIKRE